MSADASPPDSPPPNRTETGKWLAIGIAGAAFAFVAAAHLPDAVRFPGVLTVGLAVAVGWGWGRLGQSLGISPNKVFVPIVWLALLGAELLGAWKTHQDRAEYLRVKWQVLQNDPIVVAVREQLTQEPEHEPFEARQERLRRLADMNEKDALRARRLEFHGYLTSRMERLKIRVLATGYWPEIVWSVELLAGCTLGTYLAIMALKQRPRP
jgi:hypothetical protein